MKQAKRAVEEKYGLNQPLIIRYGIYLKNIIHLDFGISLSVFPGEKINDFVWVRFYKSFLIGIFSVMLTLVMGIPLGVYVGMNPDKASWPYCYFSCVNLLILFHR